MHNHLAADAIHSPGAEKAVWRSHRDSKERSDTDLRVVQLEAVPHLRRDRPAELRSLGRTGS